MMIDGTLLAIFFIVALLHSSVGLAGGSSYTAFMAIFGVPLSIIPSISLSLNTLVSSIGSVNFYRHHHFLWRLWLPLQLSALPCVYLGAQTQLPIKVFYGILFLTLFLSVLRLLKTLPASRLVSNTSDLTCPEPICPTPPNFNTTLHLLSQLRLHNVSGHIFNRPHPKSKLVKTVAKTVTSAHHSLSTYVICVGLGAILGFLSGSMGIGGGIYLVPSIVLLGLTTIKQASAVGIVFILCNSIVGLLTKWQLGQISLPLILPALIVVAIGGAIGSYLGASRLPAYRLLQALILVMLLACVLLGLKLISLFN